MVAALIISASMAETEAAGEGGDLDKKREITSSS